MDEIILEYFIDTLDFTATTDEVNDWYDSQDN